MQRCRGNPSPPFLGDVQAKTSIPCKTQPHFRAPPAARDLFWGGGGGVCVKPPGTGASHPEVMLGTVLPSSPPRILPPASLPACNNPKALRGQRVPGAALLVIRLPPN